MQAGLPEPLFEEIGTGFRVTFHRRASVVPQIDPMDQKILSYINESGGASTRQIAIHIGRTPRSALTRLNRLVKLGLLVTVSSDPKDSRKVFRVPGSQPLLRKSTVCDASGILSA